MSDIAQKVERYRSIKEQMYEYEGALLAALKVEKEAKQDLLAEGIDNYGDENCSIVKNTRVAASIPKEKLAQKLPESEDLRSLSDYVLKIPACELAGDKMLAFRTAMGKLGVSYVMDASLHHQTLSCWAKDNRDEAERLGIKVSEIETFRFKDMENKHLNHRFFSKK